METTRVSGLLDAARRFLWSVELVAAVDCNLAARSKSHGVEVHDPSDEIGWTV